MQKFHFLDPDEVDPKYQKQGLQAREEILKKWSGVSDENKCRHIVPCYDFETSFLHLFEILEKEKALGNTVVQHIFSGSRIIAISLAFASCLSEQDISYVRAKQYLFDGNSVIDEGVDENTLRTFAYLPLAYPNDKFCTLLEILLTQEEKLRTLNKPSTWYVKRDDLALQTRSKEGFSDLKDESRKSQISTTLLDMIRSNYIADSKNSPRRIPGIGKSYELNLTDHGRFWARIVRIRRGVKRGNNLRTCQACKEFMSTHT